MIEPPIKLSFVRHLVPILVTTNPANQLDIPWLNRDTFCVDCKEVCILQQGNEVVLRCLMQCINSACGPSRNITRLLCPVTQLFRVDDGL